MAPVDGVRERCERPRQQLPALIWQSRPPRAEDYSELNLTKDDCANSPEELSEDRAHREMIPHEVTGSLAEIKCDFPFTRLKPEPARQ
ncbi:hypothetical protein Anapl_16854 [Anas platyrhynchos]|uniref:Uncharacterized protein n=1 Tax=Anas platyrhynchos TaxID=8839 RepID=R0KPW1_ANAPL|nr:hypothetical protein Anapl_16854 [Anas platyrhynchos]